MSSLSLIRRKGDTQVYAAIQDDAGRNAWYQPVSPEAMQALGLTDKNVRYVGNVNVGVDSNGGLSSDKKKILDAAGLQQIAGKVGADLTPQGMGTYDTNFDPTTPEQEKQNAAVKAQMSNQYDAQQKLEASVASQNKNVQPPPGTSGGSKISAAGFDGSAPTSGDGSDGSGYTSAQLSDLIQVTLPNGAQITVPRNSNIAAVYGSQQNNPSAPVAPGQTGASAPGAPGAGADNFGGPSSSGSTPGASSSGNASASSLPPVFEQALKSLQAYIDTLAAQGKSVNPDLQLTPETINKFMDQAKTELAPWHAQQIGQAQSDLQNELKYNAAEQQQTRNSQDATYQQNQEQTAASAADRGLADSGIRALAESRLKDQYSGIVESSRRRFEQQQRAAGIGAERSLGSANMPSLAGIPAVEGVAYQPQGGVTGTLESSQKSDIYNRASDLAAGKRTMDASLIV